MPPFLSNHWVPMTQTAMVFAPETLPNCKLGFPHKQVIDGFRQKSIKQATPHILCQLRTGARRIVKLGVSNKPPCRLCACALLYAKLPLRLMRTTNSQRLFGSLCLHVGEGSAHNIHIYIYILICIHIMYFCTFVKTNTASKSSLANSNRCHRHEHARRARHRPTSGHPHQNCEGPTCIPQMETALRMVVRTREATLTAFKYLETYIILNRSTGISHYVRMGCRWPGGKFKCPI